MRDVVDKDDVEALGDLEIVGSAERPLAEIAKGEARHPADGARHGNDPPLHLDFGRHLGAPFRHPFPGPIDQPVRLRAERRHIDRQTFKLLQPVIRRRIERGYLDMALEQRDERQEQARLRPSR